MSNSVDQQFKQSTYRSNTQHTSSDIFSHNVPHRAPLLCYIDGIECPIVAADVTFGVWQIPEATIDMFPDPSLQRFGAEDRVPVVLFYLDEYYEPNTPRWRLLFEGEIVGWSYTTSSGHRALRFSCSMNIAVWTQLFLYLMSSLDGVARAVVATKEDPNAKAQAQAVPGFSLLRKGLMVPKDGKKPTNDDYIKRPYDIAYNVIRTLISDKVPEQQRSVPGINFFARWARREQFHNRWVALPFLEEPPTKTEDGKVVADGVPGIFPVLRAAQSLKAVEAVERRTIDANSGNSIYTILQNVLKSVYMELVMLPTAPCVQTRVEDGVITGLPVFRTKDEEAAYKNDMKFKKAYDDLEKIRQTFTSVSALSDVDANTLRKSFDTAETTISGLFTDITMENIYEALASLQVKRTLVGNTGPKDASMPVRLGNYFIKPQMLYGLPPNCNVLFPSMVQQVSYSENYSAQPTRLYFQDDSLVRFQQVNGMGSSVSNILLSTVSRAFPQEADLAWQRHLKKGNAAGSGKNLLIWPEEFFKGPVVARYNAPSWLLFLAAEESKKTKGHKPSTGAYIDNNIYSLYAEYEYYKNRYAARNGAVTGHFNPYVVPGFPLAVLDNKQSSFHLMGYLLSVNHSFSGSSVSTSLNFSQGRTFQEMLSLIAAEMDTETSSDSPKGLATATAPLDPIKEVRDITQHFYKAEQFYQALFHRRETVPAVFEYRKLFAFVNGDGTLEDISIEGFNEESLEREKKKLNKSLTYLQSIVNNSNKVAAYEQENTDVLKSWERDKIIHALSDAIEYYIPGMNLVKPDEVSVFQYAVDAITAKLKALDKPASVAHNLGDALTKEIVPKPSAEPFFDSFDAGMRWAARPICTLEEYIDFIHGERTGPLDGRAYSVEGEVPSARYYARIRTLTGADSTFTPTEEERGYKTPPKAVSGDDKKFPSMRAKWEKTLLAYRQNVYSKVEI